MSRASLDKDPRAVASMFDGVARRYDITNTVLSAGRDRYWRRATRAALRVGPGDTVLDLAAGTAVSTVEIAKSGAWCLAADFSVGMFHAGHQRPVPQVGADPPRSPGPRPPGHAAARRRTPPGARRGRQATRPQ